MKILQILLLCGIQGLLHLSCETEEKTNSASSQVVLEGYLFQNEPVDSIHLTLSLPFESTDTVYLPVNDAIVTIQWNNEVYVLESVGNGYYNYMGDSLMVSERQSYSISVKYDDREISSSTNVPTIPTGITLTDTILYVDTTFTFGPPEDNEQSGVDVSWDNPDNSYYYIVIESADSNAADIVLEDSNFPGGMEIVPGGNFFFRSSPFQGDFYTINTRSLEKYGRHRVKVYHVNQEYADLYENREQDSRSLTEPLTNIRNGLGIFTAFSYSEVYFYVKNKFY
jgi:hypothetical protein